MKTTKFFAAGLAAVIGAGSLLAGAAPAHARGGSENTWRWLTYGLGAATVYGAVKKSPTIALIGAAGTAYSYSRWRKSVRDRHRRERYYRSRVRGYRSYYRPVYYSRSRHYRSYRSYPAYRTRRVVRHYHRRPVKVYRTVTYYR